MRSEIQLPRGSRKPSFRGLPCARFPPPWGCETRSPSAYASSSSVPKLDLVGLGDEGLVKEARQLAHLRDVGGAAFGVPRVGLRFPEGDDHARARLRIGEHVEAS